MSWTQQRFVSALSDLDTPPANDAFWEGLRGDLLILTSSVDDVVVVMSPSDRPIESVLARSSAPRRARWYAGAAAAVVLLGAGIYHVGQPPDPRPPATPAPSDVVLTDLLSLSLDDQPRTGDSITPSVDYVLLDLAQLPEGWAASVDSAFGLIWPPTDGYRVDYTLTSPTGTSYQVTVSSGPLSLGPDNGDPVDINGHSGLQTSVYLWWEQEADVSVIVADTSSGASSPDEAMTVAAVARTLVFHALNELPIVPIDPDATPPTKVAQFAGTLNGVQFAVQARTESLRAIWVYVGDQAIAGVEEDRLSQPTDEPATAGSVNIAGVAGYGVIVFGYTEPTTAELHANLADGTVIHVPVLRNAAETYYALPIPLGVEVTSLDFVDVNGATHRTAIMPTLPAFFGHCCGTAPWTTDVLPVAMPLPAGAVLNGIVPECSSADGIEFYCRIEAFPEDLNGVDYTDYTAPIVDDTSHVSGGCRSISSDATQYICYVGQRSVDEGIIEAEVLGSPAPREYAAG